MNREEVYKIIDEEREYQDSRWGGKSHDKIHSLGDWTLFIEHYLNKLKYKLYDGPPNDAREEFRKIAALCVAVGEVWGLPER